MINICNVSDHFENDPECNYVKFKIYYHRETMQVIKFGDIPLMIYQKVLNI